MSARKNVQSTLPSFIEPSEDEYQYFYDKVLNHYSHLPGFKGDAIVKTTSILEACKKGWRNSPVTFEQRVLSKFRFVKTAKSWGRVVAEKRAEEVLQEKLIEEAYPKEENGDKGALDTYIDDKLGRSTILNELSDRDKDFFRERESYYRKEFQFNNSSDFSLLIEVIVDEIKIRRLHELEIKELRKPSPAQDRLLLFSKMVTEAHTRLSKSLTSLGVTRDQRKDELDEKNADLTKLVLSYDKKRKAREAILAREAQEEQQGLRSKWLEGDVYHVEGLPRAIHNHIPDNIDEIEDIIKDAGIQEVEGFEDGSVN